MPSVLCIGGFGELGRSTAETSDPGHFGLKRVRPIPVSDIRYRPSGYRYRQILILISAPIPVVHLPVSTVDTVACMTVVSSL